MRPEDPAGRRSLGASTGSPRGGARAATRGARPSPDGRPDGGHPAASSGRESASQAATGTKSRRTPLALARTASAAGSAPEHRPRRAHWAARAEAKRESVRGRRTSRGRPWPNGRRTASSGTRRTVPRRRARSSRRTGAGRPRVSRGSVKAERHGQAAAGPARARRPGRRKHSRTPGPWLWTRAGRASSCAMCIAEETCRLSSTNAAGGSGSRGRLPAKAARSDALQAEVEGRGVHGANRRRSPCLGDSAPGLGAPS